MEHRSLQYDITDNLKADRVFPVNLSNIQENSPEDWLRVWYQTSIDDRIGFHINKILHGESTKTSNVCDVIVSGGEYCFF